ncbi:MAG: amidase [Rhodospirillales bacterium]|nr:amidase [Rhodospirillales bacterium]MBO6786525.1 amidase [Rhodospirillales bacterium]
MTQPCDVSACEARRLMKARELSPVELLESCLERIAAVNGRVNAITALDTDRARAEAAVAEKAFRAGEAVGPLAGLPVGIKDLNATAGLRTTYGSLIHEHNVPEHDEALVARLRQAGAIILAKTNTPEFGAGSNTTNRVFGPTRNPYDPERTPGGSSGGSAAALATGMLPLAHGSDTGGSLRNPATWCGVVGFRPTPGLVAREARTLNYTHFSVQGPMGRSVADVSLMMTGLAGDDSRDPLAGPCDPDAFIDLPDADISKLRVAWSTDFGGIAPLDDDIRASFGTVMDEIGPWFGSCDARDPDFRAARDIFWTLRCVYYVANHEDRVAKHRDLLAPNIISNYEAGLSMTLPDVARAERAWAGLYKAFETFFEDIDLLIVPGNAVAPFKVADGIPKSVGGRVMENYLDASLVRSALTLTGHPVIAIPAGTDALGMPFGVQIVGKRRGDLDLLAAAHALETRIRKTPGLNLAPPELGALTA